MKKLLFAFAAAVACLGAPAARAFNLEQPDPVMNMKHAISVRGSASAEIVPTALEVLVALQGKGADARAAMVAMDKEREDVVKKLQAFGAEVEKEAPPPVIAALAAPAQPENAGRLSKKPKEAEHAGPELQARQLLRALIPFKGKDIRSVAIEDADLQRGIVAAKLVDRTLDEAAKEDAPDDGNDEANAAPKPAVGFQYFAAIPEDVRNQTLAKAAAVAKGMAARVAKALDLNADLPLIDLSASVTLSTEQRQQQRDAPFSDLEGAAPDDEDDPVVIRSPTLAMRYSVSVSASYQMK